MKITRKQLRKIIKERIGGANRYSENPAHQRRMLGKNVADVDFPILVGYEGKSEIAYNQDELDNILDDIGPRGIKYSLDSLADIEAEDASVGSKIEQYFESKDKKIIREIISLVSDVSNDVDSGVVLGDGGSARMARGQLFQIGRMAQSLHDKLNDDDEIPEWVQSKIAVIEDNIDAVADHLGYKLYRSDINDPVDS